MRRGKRPGVVAVPAPAAADARALALELAGLQPKVVLDAMSAGVVLEPGESALRHVFLWVRHRAGGRWSEAVWCPVVVTDRRLIVRVPSGALGSLWWGSLVGLEVDLDHGHVILDYGDGSPRLLAGPGCAVVAVTGVAQVYGVEALVRHDGLTALRS